MTVANDLPPFTFDTIQSILGLTCFRGIRFEFSQGTPWRRRIRELEEMLHRSNEQVGVFHWTAQSALEGGRPHFSHSEFQKIRGCVLGY